MVFYARHCPDRRYRIEEVQSIPEHPKGSEDFAPDGLSWTRDSAGRALILVTLPYPDWRQSYAVRPIVVVPMGRRHVDA